MSFFKITMENVRKHKYIKYVTTDKELFGSRTKLSYWYFPGNLLAVEIKKKYLWLNCVFSNFNTRIK